MDFSATSLAAEPACKKRSLHLPFEGESLDKYIKEVMERKVPLPFKKKPKLMATFFFSAKGTFSLSPGINLKTKA